jgi:transcription initiation factor TFIID subunit 5
MCISSVAFDLLKNYLIQNKMYSLVEVINKRIQFDIQDMASANTDCLALLEGHNFSRERSYTGVVKFGVPGEGPYNVEGVDTSKIVPDTNDAYYQNLIERIVLPQMVCRGDKEEGGEDEGNDSGGGSVLEPSVAFVTLTDTAETMICMHISKNAKQVVAGFSDSLVRVWSHHDGVCSPKIPPEDLEEEGVAGYKRMRGCGVMDEVLPRAVGSGSGVSARGAESVRMESDGTYFPKMLELVGHSQRVYSVSQDDYSSDGRLVISASADETVRLWDTHLGQCVAKNISNEGIPWAVSMSPLGYYYVTGNQLGTCSLFSVDKWMPLRVFRGHITDVTCCGWHPNMAYVATGSGDRSVRMWDVRTAECVRNFSPQLARTGLGLCSLPVGTTPSTSLAHLAEVTSLTCSPCGSIIAAGYENGTVALWDVPAGKLSALLTCSEAESTGQSSKKRTKAAAASRALSSPHTGAGNGGTAPVYSLGFSADGTGLVTGGSAGAVNVWNIAPASRWSNSMGAPPPSPLFISPHRSFYTKQTPVFSVGYGASNVVFAGGAFAVKQY